MTQRRRVAIAAFGPVLAFGCNNESSDGGSGGTPGGDCELPLTGIVEATPELSEAAGIA